MSLPLSWKTAMVLPQAQAGQGQAHKGISCCQGRFVQTVGSCASECLMGTIVSHVVNVPLDSRGANLPPKLSSCYSCQGVTTKRTQPLSLAVLGVPPGPSPAHMSASLSFLSPSHMLLPVQVNGRKTKQ